MKQNKGCERGVVRVSGWGEECSVSLFFVSSLACFSCVNGTEFFLSPQTRRGGGGGVERQPGR